MPFAAGSSGRLVQTSRLQSIRALWREHLWRWNCSSSCFDMWYDILFLCRRDRLCFIDEYNWWTLLRDVNQIKYMMLRTKGSLCCAAQRFILWELVGKKEATIGRCGRKSASQGFCKIRNGFGEHVFVTSSGQSRVDFHFREPNREHLMLWLYLLSSIETAFMPSLRGNTILLCVTRSSGGYFWSMSLFL